MWTVGSLFLANLTSAPKKTRRSSGKSEQIDSEIEVSLQDQFAMAVT